MQAKRLAIIMSIAITTENILIEFGKTVKSIGFYPEGHPNLEGAIEKTFNLIKDAIKEKGSIKWRIERTGFLEGKTQIGRGHKSLVGLAKDLFFKRINEITFTNDATLKEWKDLLLILKMDTVSLKDAGGIEKLILAKEIKGIQLNEMKYEDIRKKVIELEEQKEKEEIGTEKIEEEKPEEKAADIIHTLEEQLKAVEEREETLETLLDKLENEKNVLPYQAIADKILTRIRPIYDVKNWDGLFPVLSVFASHSSLESTRHPEQIDIASEKLRKLLTPEITGYMIARLCNRREDRRKEIQQILLLLGEEAMKQLLTTLIDTEAAYIRRQIFNALTMFGEMVRLEAERRLDDERWFVVRQMVSLLGEIGNPQSLGAIKKTYAHKDMRVKKEVLKAIGRLPSNESTVFLLEKLGEDNTTIKLQAIISLGALKDQTAVAQLGGLALKRDFFNKDIEVRKEAIRAIGLIGGDDAKVILIRLLKKRVFWGKRQHDEIRSVAAISLGKIGGEDAMEALQEAAKTSKGLVHIACEKGIEERTHH